MVITTARQWDRCLDYKIKLEVLEQLSNSWEPNKRALKFHRYLSAITLHGIGKALSIINDLFDNPFSPPIRTTRPKACGIPWHGLECSACGVKLYGNNVEEVCKYRDKFDLEDGTATILSPIYDEVDIYKGTLSNTGLKLVAKSLLVNGYSEYENCYQCDHDSPGIYTPDDGWGVSEMCKYCNGTGKITSRLIAHLRSDSDHYVGCWAVDKLMRLE